jgi:hypothetical protein
MGRIETDYLVVGAGAAGMAFTDALIADSDADVVMVDRRHRPGGHWNNAYPFVRLHQPAAYYGVNSRVLGSEAIDETGPNAGWYERVTAAEICDYFGRVLDEHLLPSGRVRFFGMHEYTTDGGEHRFVSHLTGEETTVRVRRRVVDATYLETSVPSTHTPSFGVDPDAHLIPVNGLVDVADPGSGFTVIGGGKTAMDACMWLLDNGVDPGTIRWIRPREAWCLNRAYAQPRDLVAQLMDGVAGNLEASAEAESVEDLFRRLEAGELLIRLDRSVEPTMYRCATLSQLELDALSTIEHVVRQGRVRQVGSDRIELEEGTIPTDGRQVHVDCTADGLHRAPARPIFEPGRITLQQIRTCQPTFNAAVVGFVEAAKGDDETRNGLCPPNPYPTAAIDWLSGSVISQGAERGWMADPDMGPWLERSRLNAAHGIGDHLDEPLMQSAMARWMNCGDPAIANLQRLLAAASA